MSFSTYILESECHATFSFQLLKYSFMICSCPVVMIQCWRYDIFYMYKYFIQDRISAFYKLKQAMDDALDFELTWSMIHFQAQSLFCEALHYIQ